MKTQTQARLIELILSEGAMSRSEMSRRLGISNSLVTEATAPLIDRGILRECGYKGTATGKGRRNQLLDVDISCGFALGMGLYEKTLSKTLSVGLCTLKGDTLSHRIITLPEEASGEYILKTGKAAAEEILGDCCVPEEKLFGIGFCMTRSDFEKLGITKTHFGSLPVVFEPADRIIAYSDSTGMPVNPEGMYVFGCAGVVRKLF